MDKNSPFHDVKPNMERLERDMNLPLPKVQFGILFTPRSGSSWLTDALHSTKALGHPNEWFNPTFVPSIAQSINAKDLDTYMHVLSRRMSVGGCFSFEITIYQMKCIFGNAECFLGYLPKGMPWIYLRRKDVVLQAVSLAKAVETKVFHSISSSLEQKELAERYAYVPEEIQIWMEHILDQEKKCEDFIAANNLSPMRITYEEMMALGASEVVRKIGSKVLCDIEWTSPTCTVRHEKLGTGTNAAFAERFRAEFADYVRLKENDRVRMQEHEMQWVVK